MLARSLYSLALSALIGMSSSGHQPKAVSSTLVGTTPNSAVEHRLNVMQVPQPSPTCDTPAPSKGPALPAMIFSRMMGDLVCELHADGTAEKLLSGAPFATVSPDGKEIAYWLMDKHEVHVFSPATQTDTLIESLPGAIMRELVWSREGHALLYLASAPEPPGIRVIDVDSGKGRIVQGRFTTLTESPNPNYVVAVTPTGVQRIALADGSFEILAAADNGTDASFSRSGELLGVLVPPPSAPASDHAQKEEDDSPDCAGGTSILKVQRRGKPGLLEVPFPKGFDSVLDFAFSPDDRNIAVTFSTAACDYPGDVARIYLVSIPELKMTPISPADRLSLRPQWSPDGKTVIYSDYTPSDSGLFAVDFQGRVTTRITTPRNDGPDQWMAWRIEQPSIASKQVGGQ